MAITAEISNSDGLENLNFEIKIASVLIVSTAI
jgi:hypothetical protein